MTHGVTLFLGNLFIVYYFFCFKHSRINQCIGFMLQLWIYECVNILGHLYGRELDEDLVPRIFDGLHGLSQMMQQIDCILCQQEATDCLLYRLH